jgi:biopolymer transport protein ExbD
MIHMPHRSVTRFFVPLIDVLLLLFCIFLLMPFNNEAEMEKKLEDAEQTKEQLLAITSDMDRETLKQQMTEQDKEDMKDVAEYRRKLDELEKLKKQVNQSPDQRYNFIIIDIDKDDGTLSYVDALGSRKPIKDGKDARGMIRQNLLDRDMKTKMKGKKLYYYFVYPPESSGYPVRDQEVEYRQWFVDPDPKQDRVVNSLR